MVQHFLCFYFPLYSIQEVVLSQYLTGGQEGTHTYYIKQRKKREQVNFPTPSPPPPQEKIYNRHTLIAGVEVLPLTTWCQCTAKKAVSMLVTEMRGVLSTATTGQSPPTLTTTAATSSAPGSATWRT